MSDLDKIVSAISSSKKYGSVCKDTVRRIAEQELTSQGNLKSATKAAKRRLHQVYGAFEQDLDYARAYLLLEEAYGTGSEAEIKAACRVLLDLHSSTSERLPILERFYPAIFRVTGQPGSILDLGCGLNPLSLPWMDLAPGTRYRAVDIDVDRVRFLNRYLALAGFEPLARCRDILVHPLDVADIALFLKMSPSVERQESGATLRLLSELGTSFVVVSYAIRSLGGREKGMLAHYQRLFSDMVQGRQWTVQELVFESELVFVVDKRGK
jgi:16S rRNA (guanine(1405)-N(7))-methyltransferase